METNNKPINKQPDIWVRPWDNNKTDELYKKDERFFAILIKGLITFLNKHIVLNGESINHFIFNTGSSYMYMENFDYNFSWCETSVNDQIYMKMPRCIVEIGDFSVDTAELSAPYIRGNYERLSSIDNKIKTYNAEIKRMPIEMTISLKYVLSTFNESIILIQELIDKLLFQRYFYITYLGQRIMCSIEFPNSTRIEFNKIDMSSPDVNQKNINIDLKICTNYPIINMYTEINGTTIIRSFSDNIYLVEEQLEENITDETNKIID